MRNLIYVFLLGCTFPLHAQIVLNEVAASNFNLIDDEDGDYPDWIEIYNAGVTSVNLSGYGIADHNTNTEQWKFSDTILPANGRLLVNASGKNRNCLTCPVSPVDHWETAIFDDDIWEYKNGTSEPPSNWNDVSFTGTWSTGPGGFGNGDGDDNTVIAGFSSSYYYRKEFEIADKSKIISTILSMDYDDGFVAYINDVEIARINMVGVPSHSSYANYWHEALMYMGYHPKEIEIDSALINSILVNGTNVLAVEIHQYGTDDATGRTWLHFGISTPDTYFSPNPDWFNNPGTAPDIHTDFKISNGETIYLYDPAGNKIDSIATENLQVNHVRARIPDGGAWCYSDEPTPLAPNDVTCYNGYAAAPVIITAPGFYDGGADVEISGGEIYYTTDGSKPDITSDLYTTPVHFSSTGVIKALQMEAGKLPSQVSVGTYFIDEPTSLPVVSVIANPCDLFDEGPDCPAAYDNAEGWFNRNPKVGVTVEYYDAAHVKQFDDNYKFECVGNYSISLDQKSMRFVNDEDYGSTGDITYNIFEHDKPGMEFIHGFRVRNMDQDYYGSRMKDITINRIGMPTRCGSTAYQNCVVFINGEYWGMYGAREEMDEYFLRDNYGANPDAVDMIKTGWGGEEKTIAEAGSDTAFWALEAFINGNDMSDADNYAHAAAEIDVENWVDYIATEVFTDQEEWLYILENNFRSFRSYEPNIKWRYILWDCTNSQFSSNTNTLQLSLNNPQNSMYGDMFNSLLDNQEFHDYFINRFADLINYFWTEEKNDAIIDELHAEMADEVSAQNSRWGTGSYSSWNSNVNSLYTFYDNRNANQRNHINSYFNLDGQVDITLDVNPPGAGLIKISTIVPETLPWTGVYFNGVPVTVTAIPNPGYTFVDWDDNIFIADPSEISFTNNFTGDATFTANFNGSAIANPIIISEVNYNSDTSINAGDWIELMNTSDIDINVSAYVLKQKYFYSDFTIPNNTVIPPHGYLVLAESVEDFSAQHPGITNVVGDYHFSLQNDSDIIILTDYLNDTIASFHYYDNRPWPFTADGYGRTMELKSATADPSFPGSWFEGCVGGSPGMAYELCYEDPLVDEINYKSSAAQDAGDWFEIYNYGVSDVDMSNWILKDKNGNAFKIPAGTVLSAESYLVFYSDLAKFNTQFPDIENKVGPLNFGFDGNGDVILIYDAAGILYQSVGFDDEAPYPAGPDGGGTALQILNVAENINDPANWIESCPEGSPGVEYTMPCANAVDDLIAEAGILLYPNPADASVTVNLPKEIPSEGIISIYDLSGKEIWQQEINSASTQINITSLTPGIYFLHMHAGNWEATSSFIKQ